MTANHQKSMILCDLLLEGFPGSQNIPPNGSAAASSASQVSWREAHKNNIQEQAKRLHKKGNEHHANKEYDRAVEQYKEVGFVCKVSLPYYGQ